MRPQPEGLDPGSGDLPRKGGADALPGQDGALPVAVPRDLDGSSEPWLVRMDDRIIGLYAAGLTIRNIRAHLEDVYGLQVSPHLISRITFEQLQTGKLFHAAIL